MNTMSFLSSRLGVAGSALAGLGLLIAGGAGGARVAADGLTTAPLYSTTDVMEGSITATGAGPSVQLQVTLQGKQALATYTVNICGPNPATGDFDACAAPSAGSTLTTSADGTASASVMVSDAANVMRVVITNAADPSDSATAIVINPTETEPNFPAF